MNITEEQAREKWCPFARVLDPDNFQTSYNRDYRDLNELDKNSLCIASRCMMWRWGHPNPRAYADAAKQGKVFEKRGYCGLAGEPKP